MTNVTGEDLISLADLQPHIVARYRELGNLLTKDQQVPVIHNSRKSRGERLARTAAPHRILDSKTGPLIAVRLLIITRKTLGGIHTELDGRVLGNDGSAVAGLWAAVKIPGFGGGGVLGYRSLAGNFLAGCAPSGRQAGRALARQA